MKSETGSSRKVSERGSSLIEVMVALLIMLFLMIGVLQLFSMAHLVNLGSAARTDMTCKAQQVMENIRYLHYLTKTTGGGLGKTLPLSPSAYGITFPLTTAGATGTLNPTSATYWGPTGADVFPVTTDNLTPYMISYSIVDAAPYYQVTISVRPSTVTGSRKYMGSGIKGLNGKRVDYVSQMLQ